MRTSCFLVLLPVVSSIACSSADDEPPRHDTSTATTTTTGAQSTSTLSIGGGGPDGGGGAGGDGGAPCSPDLSSDPHHCGACDVDCQGGACSSGQCGPAPEVLLNASAEKLLVDGAWLYFERSDGWLGRVSTAGGSPELLTQEPAKVGGLTVAGGFLFWTTPDEGAVKRIATDGSGDVTSIASSQSYPTRVVSDQARVYWTNYAAGAIVAADLDGGAPQTLLSFGSNVANLVTDSGWLYWSTFQLAPNVGTVSRMSTTGGPTEVVADVGDDWVNDVVAKPWGIVFNSHEAQQIRVADPTTLDATVIAEQVGLNALVAVDATHVYWSDGGSGPVLRAPLAGGSPTAVAIDASATELAVDDAALFWVSSAKKAIMRLDKP